MRPHGISSVDVPDERRGTGGRFPTDLLPLVRGRGCLELDHPLQRMDTAGYGARFFVMLASFIASPRNPLPGRPYCWATSAG
jgi:hypothetical protein